MPADAAKLIIDVCLGDGCTCEMERGMRSRHQQIWCDVKLMGQESVD